MTLQIRITQGEVTMWEYRARPPAPKAPRPVYREPIVFEPPPSVADDIAAALPTAVALALFLAAAVAWIAILGGAS